jgi:P-type conjugative transfer protein TrbG
LKENAVDRSSIVVLLLGSVLLLLLLLAVLLGCAHEEPLPPVPPHPEDLSTWSVPELVQPTPEEPPAPTPVAEKPTSAEQVHTYTPGTTFAVTVPVDVPLDLVLERGEQVRNIVGGDRAPAEATQTPRWEVKEGADGNGETLRQHVFVTAAVPHLTMGLILTTTKRTYYLTCKSVKTSPIRVVRWQYPRDPAEKLLRAKEPGLLPDPAQPRHYHIGYELTSSQPPPSWNPRQVVDDGKKTYIIYPEVTLFETVPMLRLIGPNGPQLVNARQFLNIVIVDQLVPRAELRVGLGARAETVTITRGALQTIACPGDQACPVWPQAAATRTRRQP